MNTTTCTYHHGSTLLEAYIAYPEESHGPKPLVFVCHAFQGRDGFACAKAEELATLGYVGFALDLYGKGVLGRTNSESNALMTPFMKDRMFLRERLAAAITAACALPGVDPQQLAVIGFCFGGLCALDMARNFVEIKGALSFHGLLMPPATSERLPAINAKVLALHGYKDPLVPPEQLALFADEMDSYQADWQLHVYGQALHAFTRPGANDPGFGTVYNQRADQRSRGSMLDFLQECFGI